MEDWGGGGVGMQSELGHCVELGKDEILGLEKRWVKRGLQI